MVNDIAVTSKSLVELRQIACAAKYSQDKPGASFYQTFTPNVIAWLIAEVQRLEIELETERNDVTAISATWAENVKKLDAANQRLGELGSDTP